MAMGEAAFGSCTPGGIMKLLQANSIPTEGRHGWFRAAPSRLRYRIKPHPFPSSFFIAHSWEVRCPSPQVAASNHQFFGLTEVRIITGDKTQNRMDLRTVIHWITAAVRDYFA